MRNPDRIKPFLEEIEKVEEVWSDIKGYENLYQVNVFGEIKSIYNNIILKPWINSCGYMNIKLSVKGKRKNKQIHRLVAEAFISNDENKKEVNHIDGNKSNNNINNLEWVTRNENIFHAYKIGLYDKNFRKIIQIKDDKIINIFNSIKEASEKTGINNGCICSCCGEKYRYKTAGGYTWKYYEETELLIELKKFKEDVLGK